MKNTELMVGDLVRVNRGGLCIKKDTVVRVMGIDGVNKLEEKGLFGAAHCRPLDEDQFDGGIWLDYLYPIPLTPEILEKNGFEDVGSEVYECDVLPFYIWWERDRHRLGIDIEDSTYDKENFAQMLRVPVSYVHDLQHALRLVGVNKEITI